MATLNCENQTVFIGDNREVMLGLNSSCVDLIATDPLYNKEERFDHIFGSPASRRKKKPGFDNKWAGWMTPLPMASSPYEKEYTAYLNKVKSFFSFFSFFHGGDVRIQNGQDDALFCRNFDWRWFAHLNLKNCVTDVFRTTIFTRYFLLSRRCSFFALLPNRISHTIQLVGNRL